MSEIIDAIRNMPPAAADLVLLAAIVFGSGALGFMWSYLEDDTAGQPAPRRSERRKHRDRPQP